jgi:hypothetical protein
MIEIAVRSSFLIGGSFLSGSYELLTYKESFVGGRDHPAEVGGLIGLEPISSETRRFGGAGNAMTPAGVFLSSSNPYAAYLINFSLSVLR